MSEFQIVSLAAFVIVFVVVFIIYPKNTKSAPSNKAVDKKDKGGHHYTTIVDEMTVSGTRPIPKQLAVEDAKVDCIYRHRTTGDPEAVKAAEQRSKALEQEAENKRNANAFKQYPTQHKLRYCGALDEDLVPRSPAEINAQLKALEEGPDLQIADCYNHHNYALAIWNGEKWLCGDTYDLFDVNPYLGFDTQVMSLLGNIKYSPVLAAFEERLVGASSDYEFNKVIAEGNPLFTDSTKPNAEYPFSRWVWFRDKHIAFRDKEKKDYSDNIAKATNKQVYDIALSVADEPSDSGFVSIIRTEFTKRLAILKDLDLAKQYEMDKQEQAKQELDEAEKFLKKEWLYNDIERNQ